jgi:hypothetical protein
MTGRRVVLSVDVDEWYHCRWATGSPRSRWKDTAAFFRAHYGQDGPAGDMVEIPLPTFPVLRLPAATGILTRVAGRGWTLVALRHALRKGDAQYYFHPYELGPRPSLALSLRERVFLRRLGPWMERAVEEIVLRLRSWGACFVTAGELAERLPRSG